MWARAGIVAVGWLTACYHPNAQSGLPCGEPGDTCPGDQVCDLAQTPPTCVDELGPPPDGGIDIDAPPIISCSTPGGCPASQPVCDSQTTTCRGCIADSECPGACHELAGTCTTETDTLYVAPGGTNITTCSKAAPCGQIDVALQHVTTTRRLVRVEDGTYTDGFQIRNDAIISGTDRAPAGAIIQVAPGNGTPQTDAQTTSVIEGVTISKANNEGLIIRGNLTVSRVFITEAGRHGLDNRNGTLTVFDSRIERSANQGISSTGTLHVERTVVFDNTGTGIVCNGPFTIINTIIASNGTMSGPSPGGVKLQPNAGDTAVFRFNTLSENDVAPPGVTGIQCDAAVMLENSIFADIDGLLTTEYGGSCTARYSLFDASPLAGTGNFAGNPMFVNATNDFHLAAGSQAIDKADPAATESRDVDGEARPTGSARDIGADERP